ncbi:MAG TPA: MupA/Atu3671 family FMN-dependent luciferase-like monooxygenase [Streptosporangiaceae bacterium]|nr:MupA/Atu3671 family FMN-dependent luciferase-like monooxygenase [Streptosporangiaceae bacterium]
MKVADLMTQLRKANVDLWVDGDRLRYSAPAGALASELRAALAAHKAEVIEFLDRGRGTRAATAIAAVSHDQPLPLSFPQRRIWFFEQVYPGTSTYHMAASWRITGPLDVAALRRCFQAISDRHAVLRTKFVLDGDEPAAVIIGAVPIALPVIDLAGGAETEAERLIRDELGRPFDLTRAPAMRATLLRTSADEHILMLTIHHIIADMWSVEVMLAELVALYRSEPLAPLPIQYADYAAWQRSWLAGQSQLDYWTSRLAGAPAFIDLPADRPRPQVRTYAGARQTISLPPGLLAGIDALCRRSGATRFMVMLAACAILLSRYSGETDVLIGSPVANRRRSELEHLIGFFINILVLRIELGNDPTVAELISRVRDVALGAFEHSEVPVEQLVEALHPRRDPGRPPLFQAMFILQNASTSSLELPGLSIEELPSNRAATEYDLTLEFVDSGGLATVQYNTDIFEATTAARLLGHWRTILEGIVAHPGRRVSSLPLLTDAERRQFDRWNDTGRPLPAGLVHDQIARQAARTPEAPAVTFRDRTLSYAELDAAAAALARELGRPDTPVAVCVERSPEMIISLLAVLKAGGAYLPVDTTLPAERVSYMLADAGVTTVVTTRAQQYRFAGQPARLVLADTTRPPGAPVQGAPVTAGDLAYVIYTSGSTGKPKGVMVEHGNLVNFVAAMSEVLADDDRQPRQAIGDQQSWLAVTSVSFDIAALELLFPLTRGWRVVVAGDGDVLPGGRAPARQLDFSLFYFAVSHEDDSRDRYRLLLDGARFADQHGFSAVWTPERHFNAFGGLYPNPSVTTAALATITERVRLRAGSVVLPLHDPIRVAEEWSVVDNLSGGRVGVSFASGWHADDFAIAPEPAVYGRRKEAMLESIETVRRLWQGEKVTKVNGAGRDVELAIFPRPVQADLPVWLAAAGSQETFRVAGEIGAGLLTHLLGQTLDELAEKIGIYRRAWRGPGEGNVTLMAHAFVGDSDVRATVREPFIEYLRGSFGLVRALAPSLGYDDELTREDVETLLGIAFEQYYDGSALMGTVDECVAMAGKLRDLGVDDVACLIDFGVPADAVVGSLPLLDEVRRRLERGAPRSGAAGDYSLAALIGRHGVTHVQCTPSLASILMADAASRAAFGRVRTLIVGGEALPAPLAGELAAKVRTINMYGPTETTIWSTAWPVWDLAGGVSIGRPIANTKVYILDQDLGQVPAGIPGELCIAGHGVARGYLNRPALTAERFVPSPFEPGRRVYRTGDRARLRSDGSIEFLGRIDRQVKLGGHRIELGEIESVLAGHQEITQAAVIVHADGGAGGDHLVAYLTAAGSRAGSRPSPAELRTYLLRQLPEIMVPGTQIWLDELPLTSSGKIDYQALPDPGTVQPQRSARSDAKEYEPPRDEVERAIAAVWQEVLNVDAVGVHDSFFELGGHSLMAIQMVSRLRAALHREVTLRTIFESATVADLAGRVRDAASADEVPPLRPAGRDAAIPLSFAQQRMWFFGQLNPGVPAYHLSAAFRLDGELCHQALFRAFNEVVRRHEVLRTNFRAVDGMPAQVISAARHIPLPVIDVSGLDDRQAEVARLITDEPRQPIDLEGGSLLRTTLVRVSALDHVLLLTTHHIVSDSWSLGVLAREVGALYDAYRQGQPSPLPALPVQYADFTLWQHGWLTEPAVGKQLSYWRSVLAGAPPLMSLPSDRPRPALPTHRGAQASFRLSPEISDRLKALSKDHDVTVFITLLAAFSALLHRWGGVEHVVLGVPVAGRNVPETEPLIGVFANVTVLHTGLGGDSRFHDVLRVVHDNVLGAYDHQDLPVEKLVADLAVERDPSYNPLFQVMFVYINDLVMSPSFGNLSVTPIDAHIGSVFMDLNLSMEDGPAGLRGALDYSAELFDPATIDWLLASFSGLLAAVVADPAAPIGRLPLAPGEPALPARTSEIAEDVAGQEIAGQELRVVIGSTFTANPVLESVGFWADQLNIQAAVEFAPFSQVFQQLLDPASAMASNQAGVNVVLARMDDWGSGAASVTDDFVAAVRQFQAGRQTPLVVMACPALTCDHEADTRWRAGLLSRLAAIDHVLGVDLLPMIELYGVVDYADHVSDEVGHIPYTAECFAVIGTCLARQLAALVSGYPSLIVVDAAQNLSADAREILTQAAGALAERGRRIAWCEDQDVARVARECDVGLSDCAFLSGDEAACAKVRAGCPDVVVLGHPAQADELAAYLAHTWLLDVPGGAIF